MESRAGDDYDCREINKLTENSRIVLPSTRSDVLEKKRRWRGKKKKAKREAQKQRQMLMTIKLLAAPLHFASPR